MDGWISRPQGWNLVHSLGEYDESDGEICLSKKIRDYDEIDWIFVLAGGLDQEGANHPWVKDRLDAVLSLYRVRPRKIVVLGGGTYHKAPHVNSAGFVQHEATVGAKYLIQHGVKASDLYREWGSYDTIANGFFSLLNFVIPWGISRVLVVTSDFHIPRSRAIFDWIYDIFVGDGCKLDYLWVSTHHLDQSVMSARRSKEEAALSRLNLVISRVKSPRIFHEWFYQEHQAYNCQFDVEREKIDSVAMKSY